MQYLSKKSDAMRKIMTKITISRLMIGAVLRLYTGTPLELLHNFDHKPEFLCAAGGLDVSHINPFQTPGSRDDHLPLNIDTSQAAADNFRTAVRHSVVYHYNEPDITSTGDQLNALPVPNKIRDKRNIADSSKSVNLLSS